MRPRVLLSASASLALLCGGIAAGNTAARAGTEITKHATFFYTGTAQGRGSALEQKSSFSPFEFAHHVEWQYTWEYKCRATSTYTGSAKGNVISCAADHGKVSGWARFTDDFDPSSDCNAVITTAPGSSKRIGGEFRNYAGTRMFVGGAPPVNGADLLATPRCGYPPGNIEESGPVDAFHKTVDLGANGADTFQRTITGVLTGFESTVRQHSVFNTTLRTTTRATSFTEDVLRQTADLLGYWVGEDMDADSPAVVPHPRPPQDPWFESPGDGVFDASIKDVDPRLLFTAHQTFSAGKPAKLSLQPASGARSYLGKLTTPPKLRIVVSFKPKGRSAVTYSTTLRPLLQPAVTAVEFQGSASDPTIVIHGRSLGHLPPSDPAGSISGQAGCPTMSGTAGSDYGLAFGLADITGNWAAGRSVPNGETDCIGLVPGSFSQTKVSFKLGSLYTQNPSQFTLANGDEIQVALNGAWRNVHVKYGSTVTS